MGEWGCWCCWHSGVGGGGVVQNRESPDFRSPEVGRYADGKKVQDCDYVFGSSTTFQRRKEWICESRCHQVSVRLHVFAGFFCP